MPFSYPNDLTELRESAARALSSEGESKKGYSIDYLNQLRYAAPTRAIAVIQKELERQPGDEALLNLLALANLEAGNWTAAKVTWLSMVARGIKSPGIWNNLGVLASLEGKQDKTVQYFESAASAEEPAHEAVINLGYLSLKYADGAHARQRFEQALAVNKEDAAANMGLGIALIQQGKLEEARQKLNQLATDYPKDPYVTLSRAYLLMDADADYESAKQLLEAYIDKQSLTNDEQFRSALQQANHVTKRGEELPSIEP